MISRPFIFSRHSRPDVIASLGFVSAVGPPGTSDFVDLPWLELESTPFQFEATGEHSGDRGWINGVEVVRIERRPDGRVRHFVNGDPDVFAAGELVAVEIDVGWRNRLKRQISAGLIVESVCVTNLGLTCQLRSFLPHRNRIEFGAEVLPEPDWFGHWLRWQVNRLVESGSPVQTNTSLESAISRFRVAELCEVVCRGPVVGSLIELGAIQIVATRNIGSRVRVCFRVLENQPVPFVQELG